MNGLQDVVSTNKCFKKQAKEENVWIAKETRLVSIAIGAKQITTNRRSKMKKVEPLVNHVSVMSQVSLSVIYGTSTDTCFVLRGLISVAQKKLSLLHQSVHLSELA